MNGMVIILICLAFLILGIQIGFAAQASWYSKESCQKEGTSGVYTASGERFENGQYTCAMRSREFGIYYKVTNLANGKSVIVKHNDFGPSYKLWKKGRVIDLSKAAFAKIANLKEGVIQVKVEKIKQKEKKGE